jgi:hypothetical protein
MPWVHNLTGDSRGLNPLARDGSGHGGFVRAGHAYGLRAGADESGAAG